MDSLKDNFSQQERQGYWRRLVGVLTIRGPLFARVLLSNVRLRDALDRKWRERHARAVRDIKAGDPVFYPARQWAVISKFFRLILRGKGLSGFKSTFGRFLASYEPHNRRHFEALHHLYWSALKPRDAWGLLDEIEEPLLGKGDFITHRGRRLSIDFLQSVDEFYRIQEGLGFKREDRIVFCEVGAGYGRLADVVLSAMPNASYLIFDLPESLTLAQYYLTTLHPDWAAAFYPESVDVVGSTENLKKQRLIFGLPHQLKNLPKGYVDVFVNIFSFMEMSRDQIRAYFDIIEKIEVGALFLKQHKHEINIFDASRNTRNNYPIRPDWAAIYEGTCALYDDVFEAMYRVSAKNGIGRTR